MLNVQAYIKQCQVNGLNPLVQLKEELGINVSEYPENNVVILNYDQIDSPKSHPVVMECRALTLNSDFEVVSRGLDRFFNYGEVPDMTLAVDFSRAVVYEKADGSFIKVFFHEGNWHISTRKQLFAEGVMVTGKVFRSCVLAAFSFDTEDEFQNYFNVKGDKSVTYIYEYIGPENRIVTPYKAAMMVLLTVRSNVEPYAEWDFEKVTEVAVQQKADVLNVRRPKVFKLDTAEAAVEAANSLGSLEEGFVVHDPVNGYRTKIKSLGYVAIHHLRDNGNLCPRRIAETVISGEAAEYLTYFPEDTPYFTPYQEALVELEAAIAEVYDQYKGLENQKEFALAVSQYPFRSVLFKARSSKIAVHEALKGQTINYKVELLKAFVKS